MSESEAADLADVMQAEAFRGYFDRERSELAVQLTRLVKQLTASMTTESHQRISELRRAIRLAEADIRQIDRMVDALEQRFPAVSTPRA